MIKQCPVCGGCLNVEGRSGGLFGRGRRVVHCDSCRSVLRERGRNRWHYAVDPTRNPAIYRLFNGKYITEEELEALLLAPPGAPVTAAETEPPAPVPVDMEPATEVKTWVEDATQLETALPETSEETVSVSEEEESAEVPIESESVRSSELKSPLETAIAEAEPEAEGSQVAPPPEPDLTPSEVEPVPEEPLFEAPRFIEDDDWENDDWQDET